jgi:hypothetical protein
LATRHPGDRVVAFSVQLAQAHHELRRRLATLRADPRSSLAAHCLAFCAALTAHHEGEDEGMFAGLLRERPDLAGTVAKLMQDHEMISSILQRVSSLADQPAEAAQRELDGLAAIMESHFRYEERAISQALDTAAPDDGWSAQVFRFQPPSP